MKATVPGMFWVVVIALSIPAIIPIIENTFPASSYWWSALVVVVLYAVLSAIYMFYREGLAEVGMTKPPSPSMDISSTDKPVRPPPTGAPRALRDWFWGT